MHDELSDEELRETQQIITDVPKGPWPVELSDLGIPDQVGPIAYMQTWADTDLAPTAQFISHAREWLPRYMGAYDRQRAQIRVRDERIRALEDRVRQLEGGARDGR